MQKLQIRCLVNPGCILGEGPVWNDIQQVLYWVDILDNKIYLYNPADNSLNSWTTPEHVGFIIIRENGNLIAGLKSGLYHVHLNDDEGVAVLLIDRVDEYLEHIRFNDGTIDAEGKIWACTVDMRNREALGKYFCYDRELNRTIVDEGYIVANGPALSPDDQLLYTVETVGNNQVQRGVYVSEINANRKLENKRLLIDWGKQNSYPDGVITDKEGNLWIGEFGGNILRCYSPGGTIKRKIPLPAWNVTKAVFKGKNSDVLYVTSARLGVDENTLLKYPDSGGIIEISGLLNK